MTQDKSVQRCSTRKQKEKRETTSEQAIHPKSLFRQIKGPDFYFCGSLIGHEIHFRYTRTTADAEALHMITHIIKIRFMNFMKLKPFWIFPDFS